MFEAVIVKLGALLALFRYPEVSLLLLALLLLIMESFSSDEKKSSFIGPVAMIGLLGVLILSFVFPLSEGVHWEGLYAVDHLAIFFKRFFLVATLLVLWMSLPYERRLSFSQGEFFIMPLFPTIGMLLLSSAQDFTLIFVALELVTISFYVLVAFQRNEGASLEAGVKYLIIGALSTAFLVYGIAFLFGTVGSTRLVEISVYLVDHEVTAALLLAAIGIVVGLGFKIAAVPFHIWAPDVYQGAPTPVTAFLAISSKAAGFLVLLRLFAFDGFGVSMMDKYSHAIFGLLAGFTVLLGNLAALPQRNIKRLMGYSSIGHAGFLLFGLAAVSDRGNQATLLYLILYAIAAVLAFFIICHLSEQLGGDDLSKYSGLSRRAPLSAFGLLVAFISMAGVPPLAGFVGKFSVLAAVWETDVANQTVGQESYLLLSCGLIAAVIGLYYYLGIVRQMYWSEPLGDAPKVELPLAGQVLVIVLSIGLIVLGINQQPIMDILALITG
ncbi:MAG: NADH-quinone oxidoreductase subunit N [Verrucomicrobiota bacterium]